MWGLIPRKWQLTLVIGAALIAIRGWDGLLAILGHGELTLWRSISFAVLIVGVLVAFIAEKIWRWVWRRIPVLRRAIFPDLNGEWIGYLHSTWINPETGQTPEPIPAVVAIKQGIFETTVHLKTGESQSDSRHVLLERIGGTGRHRMWYDYANTPKATARPRSQPHDGVTYLEVDVEQAPDRLEGRYYTARGTSGDIVLDRAR